MFEKQIEQFKEIILPIKTGNLSSDLLESLIISSDGGNTQLKHIASLQQEENRIHISIWDNNNTKFVTNRLNELQYSFSAAKNRVTVNIPTPTVEEKEKVIKQLKEKLELIKVSVRTERKILRDSVNVKSQDEKNKIWKTIDLASEKTIFQLEEIFNKKVAKL